MQNWIIAIFGSVLALSVLLALAATRAKPTIHDFFWGDRKLPPALTASLILTRSFSLNGLLYQVWLGYIIGWWSLLIQFVWCMSFMFLVLNINRFRDELGTGTMHGIVAKRFGERAGKLAAFASLIGFSVLIGWEVVVGATVLGNVAGMSRSLAFALPTILAVLGAGYTAMGGLRGNAGINAVQNILKSVILIGASVAMVSIIGGRDLAAPSSTISLQAAWVAMGGFALTANLAFSLFWQIVDMSNWQNLSATRVDESSARTSVILAAILVFIFPGLIGTVIGISLSGFGWMPGDITETNILNRFTEAFASMPYLSLALFAAFAAAMLSTMDGYALAASQTATWDLVMRKKVENLLPLGPDRAPNSHDTAVLLVARIFIFAVASLGALGIGQLVASGRFALFDLVYLVVIAQMSLVGPVLICLFSRSVAVPDERTGWLPILAALIAGFLSAYIGKNSEIEQAYNFAPVVTIVVSLALAVILRPRDAVRV